jgi:hypothetical protein
MNVKGKSQIILVVLIAVVIIVTMLVIYLVNINSPLTPWNNIFRQWENRFNIRHPIPGDIELFYTLKTVISSINIVLLIFLCITYIDIYIKTKSEFTIGLIIFSLVLLFYALSSNPLIHLVFGFRAFGLGPFAMLPDIFTCAALIVMLYLTLK